MDRRDNVPVGKTYNSFLEEEVAEELGLDPKLVKEMVKFTWDRVWEATHDPIKARNGIRLGKLIFPLAYISLVNKVHKLLRGIRTHRVARLDLALEVIYRAEKHRPPKYKRWRLKRADSFNIPYNKTTGEYEYSQGKRQIERDLRGELRSSE